MRSRTSSTNLRHGFKKSELEMSDYSQRCEACLPFPVTNVVGPSTYSIPLPR